jgi:lysophospholipase L1-like esterase
MRIKTVNAACPGETSASFVNASAQSNGCESSLGGGPGYRSRSPLHVGYRGSQLAFSVSYLKRNRKVRLVSLMLGANDIFLCQKTTSDGCLSASDQQAVFSTISRNVRTIVSAIRKKARYRGQIVIVNYYSLNYANSLFNTISLGINAAMDSAAMPFKVQIANGYGQLQAATTIFGGNTCTAGLLTKLSTGGCGVHPTRAGQALLGQAVVYALRL